MPEQGEPRDANAFVDLGRSLRDEGQNDAAVAAFEKAIEVDPRNARAHHNLGIVLRKLGRYPKAILAFQSATGLDPQLASAQLSLGVALAQAGRFQEALRALQWAVHLDPQNALTHHNLANAFSRHGKPKKAVAAYRKAIELDPRDARYHFNLGVVLSDLNRHEEAIRAFRAAADLDPRDSKAHYNLGTAFSTLGRHDEASASYEKAMDLDPAACSVQYYMEIAASSLKRYAEAQAAFRAAIELDPRDAVAHYNLGVVLDAVHRHDECISAYEQAIELDPLDPRPYYNLGVKLLDTAPDAALPLLSRAWYLHRDAGAAPANPLSPASILALADIFTAKAHAPLLALQIVGELRRGGCHYAALYRDIAAQCEPIITLQNLLALDSELPRYEQLWLAATLTFHSGDPAAACKLLAEAETASGEGARPALHYYLARAADAMLHAERDPIRASALRSAQANARGSDSSARSDDLYYAALLLLDFAVAASEAEAHELRTRALDCVQRCTAAAPVHLAAFHLQALCLHQLGREDDFQRAALRVFELEERAFASGAGFLSQPAPLDVGLSLGDVRASIQRIARAHEIAEAVELLREVRCEPARPS